MRLDKYLKVSRLIKRRTVAKDITEAGRVSVNGRAAKPAAEVKVGDVLEIGFGTKKIRVEVLDIKEAVAANQAKELYRVLE
jgi:ribosomal 50S subunit-recycling heat shock protein